MSEHALETAPSGSSSATGTAVSGTYPALKSGRNNVGAGKTLPVVAAEKPDMEHLAKQMNVARRNLGNDLRFKVDLDRGHTVLQVVDRETGEIIRQIPQEKAVVVLSENGSVGIRLLDDLV
jgi:flagellar protein FlaG